MLLNRKFNPDIRSPKEQKFIIKNSVRKPKNPVPLLQRNSSMESFKIVKKRPDLMLGTNSLSPPRRLVPVDINIDVQDSPHRSFKKVKIEDLGKSLQSLKSTNSILEILTNRINEEASVPETPMKPKMKAPFKLNVTIMRTQPKPKKQLIPAYIKTDKLLR